MRALFLTFLICLFALYHSSSALNKKVGKKLKTTTVPTTLPSDDAVGEEDDGAIEARTNDWETAAAGGSAQSQGRSDVKQQLANLVDQLSDMDSRIPGSGSKRPQTACVPKQQDLCCESKTNSKTLVQYWRCSYNCERFELEPITAAAAAAAAAISSVDMNDSSSSGAARLTSAWILGSMLAGVAAILV